MPKDTSRLKSSAEENESGNLVILVVPCFNEENRWIPEYWERISKIQDLKLCFVNDGSSDKTSFKITPLLVKSEHVLLELPNNLGKAEAIRHGFNHALAEQPLGIGFLDADGAFPFVDIQTQIAVFRRLSQAGKTPPAVWSSRVQLAGRLIERNLLRHYFARILMTLLAIRLKFLIYDTQCGMKIFPVSKTFEACLKEPFETRWFVDLEIFLRWRRESGTDMEIWEEPLLGWKDIGGSKLSARQYLTVLKDIRKLNSYAKRTSKYAAKPH